MALTPVQNNYGDAAHRNFEIKKKPCEHVANVEPSGQTFHSEAIPLISIKPSLSKSEDRSRTNARKMHSFLPGNPLFPAFVGISVILTNAGVAS